MPELCLGYTTIPWSCTATAERVCDLACWPSAAAYIQQLVAAAHVDLKAASRKERYRLTLCRCILVLCNVVTLACPRYSLCPQRFEC